MPVAAHNSVCPKNIGVLRRPFYRGQHAYDPVRNAFSGLLPVSASGLSGTGGAGSQTSGGCVWRITDFPRISNSPHTGSMPTKKPNGRKYSKKAGEVVEREMHKMKQGTLKSGRSGKKGQEPEAGNCDCPLRSSGRGRQGSAQEISVVLFVTTLQRFSARSLGGGNDNSYRAV